MKLIFKHAFWPVLGFMVISRTKTWWKISQWYQFWLPESWIFNLELQYCSKTSLMTIYGDIWLKLLCQHVFWHIMRFMVTSRAKIWWKNMQICKFWLPESWIFKLEPQYFAETSLMTIYDHIWLKLIYLDIILFRDQIRCSGFRRGKICMCGIFLTNFLQWSSS